MREKHPTTNQADLANDAEWTVLGDLARRGLVTLAKERSPLPPPPRTPTIPFDELMAGLEEDRKDQWE